MGILNVTPDSFYDGNPLLNLESIIQKGLNLVAQGADIIDVGGESTRPGAKPVPLDVELSRVIPVVKSIRSQASIDISIDTTKAKVAESAIMAGATIINDVSGCSADSEMIPILQKYPKVKVVVMHARGNPETMGKMTNYQDLLRDIDSELMLRLNLLSESKIEKERIIIDPGFGFAKNTEQNLELLAHIDQLHELGYPILAGLSRKKFLGFIGGDIDADRRLPLTLAACFWLLIKGVQIIRVHDVTEMVQVRSLFNALVSRGGIK